MEFNTRKKLHIYARPRIFLYHGNQNDNVIDCIAIPLK